MNLSFSIYMTKEDILVIMIDGIPWELKIQYDMKDIFTIYTTTENKERLCGLCNLPLNKLDSYSLCT